MATNTMNTTLPYWESPGYKGDKVRDLNAALIAITTLIVGARLYTRGFLSKTFGLDDALAFMGYVLVITQSALDIRSVNYGSGAHVEFVPPSLLPKFWVALVNNTLIYFIATGIVRLSIVAFLPRLTKDLNSPSFTKAVYTVGFIIVAQTLTCFFYRLTECKPVADIWKLPQTPGLRCVSAQQEQDSIIAHQAIGIFVDLALFIMPIWIIHSKMMNSAKKIQVILVFSVGLFVVITGIVRMYFLNTLLFLSDPTFSMSTIGPWTDLEGHTGLWVASFPALQPLLRIIFNKIGLRSILDSYGRTNNIGSKNHSVIPTIGGSGARKTGYALNSSERDDFDDASQRGIVGKTNQSDTELDNLSSDSGYIHKKVDYDVRVEEGIVRDDQVHTHNVVMQGTNKSWVDV